MEGVRYTSTAVQPSGAIALSWAAPPRATGYSIGVMAPERMGDDSANIIMWSSADRPATFIVMEDLTPAEVNRLIGLKAVLPPTTTNCAIPAEVVKATKDGSMLMFTAYGDEATFIHPPRPADVKVPWDQEWFSRVNFKSMRMDMVSPQGVHGHGGDDVGRSLGRPGDARHAARRDVGRGVLQADRCAAAAKPSVADVVPGGRLLRGLGRKKPEPPSATDPRCAPEEEVARVSAARSTRARP